MTRNIDAWLEPRRNAVRQAFQVPQEKQPLVDSFFEKLRQLAESSSDQGDFERRMLSSPLSLEFNQLMADLMPYVRQSPYADNAGHSASTTSGNSVNDRLYKGIDTSAANRQPSRQDTKTEMKAAARMVAEEVGWHIPIVRRVLTWLNLWHLLRRWFGKR